MTKLALGALVIAAIAGCQANDQRDEGVGGDESQATEDRRLSANDISVLFPLPADAADVANLVGLDAQLSDGRPLVTAAVFDAIFNVATQKGGLGALRPESLSKTQSFDGGDFEQSDLGPSVRAPIKDAKSWRVVSFRYDPCFPFEDASAPCRTQVRLIAQPFSAGGLPQDSAMHIIYEFGAADAAPLARALFAIKSPATTGKPLGVHPVLASEPLSGKTAENFRTFLTTNLTRGRMTTWAFMGLSGKAKPWVFLGGIVRDGNLFVVSQQFPGNHAPSVRLDVGGNNLISDPMPANPIFPVPPEDHPNTVRLIDPKVTLTKDDADKAMRLLNPHLTNLLLASQSDLRHVDCVSCHTVGSFVSLRADESPAFAKQLADSSLRFSDSGTSGTSPSIEPGTVQQGRWNVHNFGYSDTARPSVSPRTANETALSVRFANDLLARPTPP